MQMLRENLPPVGSRRFAGLLHHALRASPVGVGPPAFWRGGPGREAGPAADAPHKLSADLPMSDQNEQQSEGRQNQGGRPRKDPRDRRTKRYGLRLSPKEYEEIQDRAERAGLSVAEYLRRRALGKPISTKVEKKTTEELNRIGVHLNQIARRASSGDLPDVASEAEAAIQEVRALIDQIGQMDR